MNLRKKCRAITLAKRFPSHPRPRPYPLLRGYARYIEASKTRIGSFASDVNDDKRGAEERAHGARRTLVYVFDTCLRLLHPFMPYVTEALWQQLPRTGEALMVSPWPKVDDVTLAVDEQAIDR